MFKIVLAVLAFCIMSFIFVQSKQHKKQKKQRKVAQLGVHHTFLLKKYQKPQQFQFQVSCQKKAMINFELSPRLKLLHKNIFLNIDFQANPCLKVQQDTSRVIIDEQNWDLQIQNICCEKKNLTKVFNETIIVRVKDGFKLLGVPIKTKIWNIVIPIITSMCICLFVWFSDFSQPKSQHANFLIKFYRNKKHHQNYLQKKADMKIDVVKDTNIKSQ